VISVCSVVKSRFGAPASGQVESLETQKTDGKIDIVSLAEIKTAIQQLSFEDRAGLAAWLHGWKDDEWDEEMKRDIASGKLDSVLHEVEQEHN
jgi:hypothetical protein